MIHSKNHSKSSSVRPEFFYSCKKVSKGYARALKDTLQQVQGERSENWTQCLLLSLSKYQGERGKTLGKINGCKTGFTLIETVMALAITALVLTPIFIMHGMILQHASSRSNDFDMILYCKALLAEARQKQEPDAQEFELDKPVAEFDATCKYVLDKSVDQKSLFASLPGLHRESVTIDWTVKEEKRQERLVTFIYKKPEQKKS